MNDDASISLEIKSPIADHRLSPQQAHLWELHQKGTVTYVCCEVEIDGLLDTEQLRIAVANVSGAYPVLRSRLVHQPGSLIPIQFPGDEETWGEILDFTHLSDTDLDERLNELWASQTLWHNDWELGTPLHAQLVRLGGTKSRLLLSLCPIFGDGYTMGLVVGTIAQAYGSLPDQSCLFAESLRYSQFAEWQNELIETEDAALQEAKDFWSSRPDGVGVSGLPALQDKLIPVEFSPSVVSVNIADSVSNAIARGASLCGVDENEFLFASWCAFLWRWTKFDHASVSYTSDGRTFEELQNVFGLTAKSLPIGIAATGTEPFRSFCQQTQTRLAEALDWQDYFLFGAKYVSDAGANSLSPFGFTYHQATGVQTVDGLRWIIRRTETVLEPKGLTLVCTRDPDGFKTEMVYDKNLFKGTIVQRLLDEWIALTFDAAAHPDKRLDRLEMLTEDERSQLLVGLNNTASPYPNEQCFHELFEDQVRKAPDAVAVRFGTTQISYHQLNDRADVLAADLGDFGVGPDARVAICIERSIDMVVAMLAVLKAGGAYVPLDASYPLDRVAWIMEDSTPALVLTTSDLIDRLPGSSIPVVCLDEMSSSALHSNDNGLMRPCPDNLAYIIYTSGSTGRPKGVMVPHRGLVNYLHWCSTAYRLTQGNGTLVDTSIGFDLTVTSLLAPLSAGQTAILTPDTMGVASLCDALETEHNLTLVKTTPAHLEVVRNLLPNREAGSSRLYIIGGETLKWDTVAFLREHAPETICINEYGPTETVVGCCMYEVPHSGIFGLSVPIGRPIANTSLYLLDSYLQPVPMGLPGELYIGGVGVVRGYMNRPDLTAASFIPDAFGCEPGDRLYRTGDICRYLDDGNIEYLGRIDHQVKLRGFRIELGEIENVLLRQDRVREAVVVVREDCPGDKRLVAYVVGDGEATDINAIRERIHDVLPEYMVPTAIVSLSQLPLTSHGKIDREALPAPATDATQGGSVRPRTAVEQVLAGIWEELLGNEDIDVHQDFFGVGGHSLLATQAISYVRETFQVEVPLIAMFQAPSVAAFAELILKDLETRSQIESVAALLCSLSELSEDDLEERLRSIDSKPN